MKNSIKIFGLLLLMMALVLTAGCSGEKKEAASKDNSKPAESQQSINIKLATGNTGSAIYALGGGLKQAIEKHIPGAKVTVVGSAGYGENAVLVASKEAEMGTLSGVAAKAALKQKPELYDGLAYIATTHQTLQHTVVSAKSDIQTYDNLKGKKVSVGEAGSGTEQVSKALLKVYGLDYNSIKPQYLSFNESVEALQNGTLDAILLTTMYPNPGIMSLATQKEIRLLGMTDEEIKKLNEYYSPGASSFVVSQIPQDTYKGQTQAVVTAGAPAPYVVHKDMPADLAYQIAKTMIEHADEVAKVHPAASQWVIENALMGEDFPYHPGAVKYYKEIGAWDKRSAGAHE